MDGFDSYIFTNLTTYGTDQTMVQRYMTTGTEKQARKSVLTNAVLTIPATLLFFFVGTVLYVYYKHNPQELSITVSDGDAILPGIFIPSYRREWSVC